MAKTKKTVTKRTPTNKKGSSAAKKAKAKKSADQGSESDATVTVDRRSRQDRRNSSDRRKKTAPVAVERRKIERREKVTRRRQIDPTTCERDYTAEEIEFMNAVEEYKRASGRMFPTCSEILEVIRKLGYEKRAAEDRAESTTRDTASEGVQPAGIGIELPQQQELAV